MDILKSLHLDEASSEAQCFKILVGNASAPHALFGSSPCRRVSTSETDISEFSGVVLE